MGLTDTIVQLMLEQGRARAAGQIGAANAYAGALQNIGQTVGAIPQQIEAAKQAQDVQRARDARQTLSDAMNPANVPEVDQNGVKLKDVNGIGDYMASRGFGPEFVNAAQHLDGLNQSLLSVQQARQQLIQRGALGVAAANYDPTIANAFLDTLDAKPNSIYPHEVIQQVRDHIQDNPEGLKNLVNGIIGPQKPLEMPATPRGGAPAQFLDPITHQVIATGSTAPATPPTEPEIALRAAAGEPQAQAAMSILKPAPKGDTAAADDQRFEKIQTAMNLKQQIDPADFAWYNAYKTRKLLGVDQSGAIALQRQAASELFTKQETGRKELSDKVDQPYIDASEKAETLRNVVQAAQGGNMVAGSLQPLLATLGVTTMEGVKRINNTELQNVAGAGSLLDRIKGKVGKLTEGQPMDKALQSDLIALGNLLQRSAYDKYLKAHQTTVQRYSLTDEQPFTAPQPAVIAPPTVTDPGLSALGKR